MTVETFRVERVGVGGYRHEDSKSLEKGLKESIDPKGRKMKGWVGTNTQSLGKGLKKSIDPRDCR